MASSVVPHPEVRSAAEPRRKHKSDPVRSYDRRNKMTELKGYHAHVYYDAETKPVAAKLEAN